MPRADGLPWLIVHGAGHNARRLRASLRSPADCVELDVRAGVGGAAAARAEVRHDPLVHDQIPFLTHRRGLPRLRLRRLWLDEVRAPGRIFLDIKDSRPEAAKAIIRALRAAGTLEDAAASTPLWAQLDRLAMVAPGIGHYYTIRSLRGDADALWRAYEQRMDQGSPGAGVSIRFDLATPDRLQALRAAGLRAICYPVNDFATGMELLRAGAGGLTTDRLHLIRRGRDALDRRGEAGPGARIIGA